MNLFRRIFMHMHERVLRRLDSPAISYKQRIFNNMDNFYRYARKGDIILVEGRSELSRIIKLFSNSHWSHSAMYVGDELIRKNRPDREKYLEKFGEEAKHLVIEALAGEGVVANPASKYQDHNIRICRPFKLYKEDQQVVLDHVINSIGQQYDQQNIIDIALLLLPKWLNPFKKRSIRACLGNCDGFQVICSGILARAFQRVGYPVFPELRESFAQAEAHPDNPFGAPLIMRHYSQILPRDFDLSPNFEIIKFNVIATGKFDYRNLVWDEEEDL